MLSKHFKQCAMIGCFLFYNSSIYAEQRVPVKSNMGQPDEIFVKRALMQDLSPSAVESNLYFLPITSITNDQFNGKIYVNNGTGFSISEAKKGLRYSKILLTSPRGAKYSIQKGDINCLTPCPIDSVNVTINPSNGGSNHQTRTVSINSDNEINGLWQINIKDLPRNTSSKDFLVTHEDSTLLALRDSDQISLENRPNKFILELREQRPISPVPGPIPIPIPGAPQQDKEDSYTVINGSQILSLDAKVSVAPRSSGTLPLNLGPTQLGVSISPDGEMSVDVPGLPAGNYGLEVDFTAFMANGEVIQRTAFYGFPVLRSPGTLIGSSMTKVIDTNRLEVTLDIESTHEKTENIIAVYAEIWNDQKPVSFINTMANIDENSQIKMAIDSRWFALADIKNHHEFEFKNIKLLDPDTFLIIDEMKSIKVPVSRFPDSAFSKVKDITIDKSMLQGVNDIYLKVNNAQSEKDNRGTFNNGIFLVHGWCDNANAWNQNFFNDGPTVEYSNSDSSISRNNFAIAIRNQADATFTDWFSVVAHSQGGQAAVHLQAYFFSGLDLSPAPRPIQTVGTPFQGSTLMDIYFFSGAGIINAIFNFSDCEPQFTLTTPSSFFWSIFLPSSAQNDTYYYRTIHDTPNNFWQRLQFWRWKCNIASYILAGVDDGTVRPFKSWLLSGNNMGITEGQCHTGGMRYSDQRDDAGRNNIMDQMGRVNATWTAWLDRDDPSGSGDWEQRSLHGSVCANPINYQARRVGSGTPANSTGEIFFRNSPADGLVCRNADQPDNTCFDYQVRFLCP